MSKVAALFPALGAGGGAAAGAAAGAGAAGLGTILTGAALAGVGALGNNYARRKAVKQQNAANAAWTQYQRQQQDRFDALDQEKADESRAALDEYLNQAGAENQQQIVDEETDRLEEYLMPTRNPAEATADALFSGAKKFGTEEFNTAVSSGIADATSKARDRVKALAQIASYGGSSGGLDNTISGLFSDARTNIGATNADRMGNLRALQRYTEVQPNRIQFQSTGLGDLLMGIGGNVMGQGFNTMVMGPGSPGSGTISAAATPTSPGGTPTLLPPSRYRFNL